MSPTSLLTILRPNSVDQDFGKLIVTVTVCICIDVVSWNLVHSAADILCGIS